MTLYFDLPRTTPVAADPTPWRDYRPSPRLVHTAVGSGLLTVLVAAAGGWSLLLGEGAAAVACTIATLVLGHLSGLLLHLWVRPYNTGDRMRIAAAGDGSPGLTFRYSGRLYYWYGGFLGLLTIAQLGLAVTVWPFAAGALLSGAALVMLSRHAPGRLTLTPDGVHHHGIRHQRFLPWESISDILPGEQAHIPIIAAPTTGGQPHLTIQVPWLDTDPALVLQALRWYHANPVHRFELSYHIACDRTRQRAWHLH
ncbi:hypothetical protein ACWT_2589 [Actinoplanes sp. SE50]|uniref:hypothetical protein n=1 Tax=unclassified Actinoplanes TaxID=2626549 RepID=UPI00023ED04E|nr:MULTISPECIES: hypothetical protein [unclassified Actinoplanes]AEV83852.1 hypothetical protein ACPL_2957 [Actinoplanes sp. SE50/110]ATO82004.1 hypothetical protein ACWT_2589 [Actinoplanes sp. SE50]SLL99412.1 hypothetical protein ACSP50_2643 [Actinoplanes sp. SE50/110]